MQTTDIFAKEIRKQSGLSLKEMSNISCSLFKTNYEEWEAGLFAPTYDQIAEMSLACNVNLAAIICASHERISIYIHNDGKCIH
jgi:transcriptional regulator with XRE-family HTH domain